MPCLFNQENTVLPRTRMLLGLVLLLLTPFAIAQNNLGELLDVGAKRVSAEEFRQDVAQHTLVGNLTAQGGNMELMYSNGGMIRGASSLYTGTPLSIAALGQVDGVWNIDDSGRICSSMMVGRIFLPLRCQYWFKYKDDYFVADSDTDPKAKVLRRTVKQ